MSAMIEPPIDMPVAARALWQRVYRQARAKWVGKLEEYYDEDAQLTANVAVVGWFSARGGTWARRHYSSPGMSPSPGSTFVLGEFEGVECVDQAGSFIEHVFVPDKAKGERRPLLVWNEDLRACFVFPKLELGPCNAPMQAREKRLVSMWNRGRKAKCAAPIRSSTRARLGTPMPAIDISYYSDKFPDRDGVRRWKHYIHHFEGDVTATLSLEALPQVVMIRGGKLRVTPSGLEG
jgi:hypothetical protein